MMNIGKLEMLTRAGFAARGVMYLLIGLLALRSGRTEDGAGVLATLDSDLGRIALALMALGFAGYGVWRLSEAAVDTQGYGSEAKGIVLRASGAISGVIHLSLSYLAVRLSLQIGGAGDGDSAQTGTAAALDLPGGQLLVGAAAVALVVAGSFQLLRAVRADFTKHLDQRAAHRVWVIWLGRAGHAARGVIFLAMGWLLARAAWFTRAGEAGDMGEALDSLPVSARSWAAAGLLLFGLFSLVEARHRRINDPHVLERLKGLR
jgi:hypothetical protein